ncbi:MAG: lactate utilization protein [Verrucomicrobiae bacterium]|nr:lactate utilization protein [Verrucomicrobiae bacterium]
MSERESILTRIREALRVQTRGHGKAHLPTPEEHRRVLPAVGVGDEALLEQFARNAAELRATFKTLPDVGAFAREVRALRDAHGWRRVAAHRGTLVQTAVDALDLTPLWTDGGFDKHELARCDVGVSECDALVAQTGTVVVTSRSAGGRALSVLPPHHLVLARREQLVADLPDAFALLKEKYGADFPSMISLITGPSRTGDIERILVLGAHGPKQLTILCLWQEKKPLLDDWL